MDPSVVEKPTRKKTIKSGLKRFWRKISAQELLLDEQSSESTMEGTTHSPRIRESTRYEDLTILDAEDAQLLRLESGVELTIFGLAECTLTHRLDHAPCRHDVRLAFALNSGCRSRMPLLRDQNSYAIYKLLRLFDRDPAQALGGHFAKHEADERAGRFGDFLSKANPTATCLQLVIEQKHRSRSCSVADLSSLLALQSLEELTTRPPSPASAPGSTWSTPREGVGPAQELVERGFESKAHPFPRVMKGSSSWEVL